MRRKNGFSRLSESVLGSFSSSLVRGIATDGNPRFPTAMHSTIALVLIATLMEPVGAQNRAPFVVQ